MRFGDPANFAIEAELELNLRRPSAVWGRMCVWCRGIALGDISEQYCALFPAFMEFRWLSSHINELWDPELAGLDDVALWNFLDELLYGYHGDIEVHDDRTVQECERDWVRWGVFNFLTNWGEQFDGYKSFIASPPGDTVRILSRRLPSTMGLSVEVSRAAFKSASEQFVAWFDAQNARLRGPDP